jgi:hypothetical protein
MVDIIFFFTNKNKVPSYLKLLKKKVSCHFEQIQIIL